DRTRRLRHDVEAGELVRWSTAPDGSVMHHVTRVPDYLTCQEQPHLPWGSLAGPDLVPRLDAPALCPDVVVVPQLRGLLRHRAGEIVHLRPIGLQIVQLPFPGIP